MNIITNIADQNNNDLQYVGIRAEDYSKWERRAPITPQDMEEIQKRNPYVRFIVQSSRKRIFQDKEYEAVGAQISDDLSKCQLILGIKRPQNEQDILPDRSYIFFSHVIKTQAQNMGLLDTLLKKKIRFFDIECMHDERGKRVITFGKQGGIAATIDFLAGMGQFILQKGYSTPLLNIAYSYKYFNTVSAFDHLQKVGQEICRKKLPQDICPLIIGITGKGGVAEGTWEVLGNLPIKIVDPDQLQYLVQDKNNVEHRTTIYVTHIDFKHQVKKIKTKSDKKHVFNNEDYKENPEKYEPIFAQKYLPYISVLYHTQYWDNRYPRLIENRQLTQLSKENKIRLLGICDISCDLKGAIEVLDTYTNPDKPFFIYDIITQYKEPQIKYKENNILYMGFDSQPSLLPYDSSIQCSSVLKKYIRHLIQVPYNAPFNKQNLPQALKNGMITLNGELTEDYKFIDLTRKRKAILGMPTQEPKMIQNVDIKMSGHLFDTGAINDVVVLLGQLKTKFVYLESDVGGKVSLISYVIIRINSHSVDKLNAAKIGIEKICQKKKIQFDIIKDIKVEEQSQPQPKL